MRVDVLAEYISYLEPMPPVTAALDRWKSPYPSQKIHMYQWFHGQQYAHDGAYGRMSGNYSAKTAYNRFQNPGGLLWLAESLGEDEAILRQAAEAASEAERNRAKYDGKSRCAAFRRVIPWARIMALYAHWDGWRFDEKIVPLIVVDSRTDYPAIRPEKRYKYLAILTDEMTTAKERRQRDALEQAIKRGLIVH